jgi:hypothetical protein
MRGDSILVTNWANGLWTPRDKQVEKFVAGMHRTMAALYIYIYVAATFRVYVVNLLLLWFLAGFRPKLGPRACPTAPA